MDHFMGVLTFAVATISGLITGVLLDVGGFWSWCQAQRIAIRDLRAIIKEKNAEIDSLNDQLDGVADAPVGNFANGPADDGRPSDFASKF